MEELNKKNKERIKAYQQLYTQEMENEQVLEELKLCEDNQTIFKSVGPIIMKQDKAEAILTVEKRLEYIRAQKELTKSEIDKTNSKLKEMIESGITKETITINNGGNNEQK
ncbi:prefoldin beta subunit [Babesia microti strain RI]|uniref:Prefoldin beta subunit n=1 Tax=Babesia microti (strain RI) TaxID=1133968 RepID=I7J5Y5_BABMR|nr:prefoldin beta subunit [Babesia microti strain RI]CCF73322.1 prefoldin beta subunit [Babesia microti strain RI]|eukprot:XP_012647931.1 prefoldin beta subunit [Babesia microti strain RI]